ncbi:MAG: aldehyde dehydrogenase family protein [Firmicutes bacterium]|nr:aldehyde dehydrogenase family protein [Bacillota bacterium]
MAQEKWLAWIDGHPTAPREGRFFDVEEPATGGVLAQAAQCGIEDVKAAITAARRSFEAGVWSTISATARGKTLLRLAQRIRDQADDLARWETRQVGKPIRDAKDEVLTAADCFEYYAGAANKIYGHTIPVSAAGFDYTLRVPVGVVGLVVPWNFPFLITAWKVAPALAAGNSVIVKPASYTPLTALLLGRLGTEAGLPDGVLNIVPGPGRETGEALVADPGVDKVAFTGETITGARILQLAAPNITRVSLELGGKSPTVVFNGVDLDRVAYLAAQSAYANSGQDCCARSRILVERESYQVFVDHFVKHVQNMTIGDPLDPENAMGPLVSASHRDHVAQYVEKGVSEGAELVLDPRNREVPSNGFYLAPAIFAQAKPDMSIVREEIFGPVTTVQVFESEAEAIRMANDTTYGLSGSIFTRDVGQALRVANQVRAGVISVNTIKSVHLEAPFGGFKQSGMGRELGMEALEMYTEVKNVFISMD